jgi:hypothetical protein
MSENEQSHRQLATFVVRSASVSDRQLLKNWAQEMLLIRSLPISRFKKAKRVYSETFSRKAIWPALRVFYRELKRIAWIERSRTARLGMSGAVAGVALFGGKAAGIAALGTAIAVPLWIVLGAGGAFAGVLIEIIVGRDWDTAQKCGGFAARNELSYLSTKVG